MFQKKIPPYFVMFVCEKIIFILIFSRADAMDQLEQRVNEFFMNAKKNKPEWREEQMTSIKKVRISQEWVPFFFFLRS